MPSAVRVAVVVWVLAVASAAGGVVTASSHVGFSLALYALAVALGVATAVALLRGAALRRRARPAPPPAAGSSLVTRLDYLPAVTSRAPRLRWRGDHYWAIGRLGDVGGTGTDDERELVGSAVSRAPGGETDAAGSRATGSVQTAAVEGRRRPSD